MKKHNPSQNTDLRNAGVKAPIGTAQRINEWLSPSSELDKLAAACDVIGVNMCVHVICVVLLVFYKQIRRGVQNRSGHWPHIWNMEIRQRHSYSTHTSIHSYPYFTPPQNGGEAWQIDNVPIGTYILACLSSCVMWLVYLP